MGHPLEPLTQEEIANAVAVFKGDERFRDTHRFCALTLHEPPKQAVLEWTPDNGNGVAREAAALLVDRGTGVTTEAVASLTEKAVTAWTDLPDAHAPYLLEEVMEAIEVVKADAGWRAALASRGVDAVDAVQCDPWPAGNFGVPEEQGRRLCRVVSYVRDFPADNGYAHPIEGVVATVDVVARVVVDLMDGPVIAVPPRQWNYSAAEVGARREDLKPLEITQPEGPSFTVDGNEIRWQRWRLRVSMHPVDGLVIHTVGYEDPAQDGRLRPILYRAALGEMVVPYGDTAMGHRWKNAFDSGELALGRFPFLNSLALGCDCVGEIRYLDAPQVSEQGDPMAVEQAICIHEEDYGILWKHVDLNTFTPEVRRSRRLVVSSIHTVGNYEYGFYWYFYLDGTLQLEVKLTGILQTMAVEPGTDPEHASLVAPQVAAPFHQHLFCFRLDLDVDGTDNAVYESELVAAPPGDGNELGNVMVLSRTLLARESEAQRDVDAHRSRSWTVVNNARTNLVSRPVGYRLLPGLAATLLAGEGSAIAARAAFARHNLWVTPYQAEERRAAGHPVCHPGGAGLPVFAAADRDLVDTDVVLWYTFGVNHVPRPEDWPVMPVEYAGFTLSPFGFFDCNPALDVPAPADHCET